MRRRLVALLLVLPLLAGACGGSESSDPAATGSDVDDTDISSAGTLGGVGFDGTVYAAEDACQFSSTGYQEDRYTIVSTDGEELRLNVGFDEQVQPFVTITTPDGTTTLFEVELEGDVFERIQYSEDDVVVDVDRPDYTVYGACDGPDESGLGDDEDCGDFDCGESCETHGTKYEVCEYTDSGRPPVYDDSYTDEGLWGAYGVNTEFVYGAVKVCANYGPNSAAWYYTMVDGDTNSTNYLTLFDDFSADTIEVSIALGPDEDPVEELTVARSEFTTADGRSGLQYDPGDRTTSFRLLAPFPEDDSPDCSDDSFF